MRYQFLGGLLACLLLATGALAQPSPCNDHKTKTDAHVLARPVSDRQGGDTILTATVIDAIPFTDTGATCDNANDYDEACPFDGSTAPDVVYSYTPVSDVTISVDLCTSSYDTKVYIYDESLEVVACNDDFYTAGECNEYTSYIEYAPLVGRTTYYIVVDGYGEDCGEYVMDLNVHTPCNVLCPAGAMIEGEPPLHDDYWDEFNGGCCGSEIPIFQDLPGRDNGLQVLCARTGWFTMAGGNTRDTDWFVARIGSTGTIEVRGDADYPTYLFELGPLNCSDVGVLQNVPIGPCEEGVMTITGEPGDEVWIWTGPVNFTPPGGFEGFEYGYVLWFDGLAPAGLTGVPDGPLMAPRSLSTVKDLFD